MAKKKTQGPHEATLTVAELANILGATHEQVRTWAFSDLLPHEFGHACLLKFRWSAVAGALRESLDARLASPAQEKTPIGSQEVMTAINRG
jgi:hypothetical protein